MFMLLIWVAALVAALYVYLRRVYSTFSRAGVMSLPTVPLLGNMAGVLFKREHVTHHIEKLYFSHSTERFVGTYEFIRPMLVVRDLELVKRIMIMNNDHFFDHRSLVDGEVDTIFGRGLFNLNGQEWKHMRPFISPAFTSSKMKLMVPFMVDVGNCMVTWLENKIKSNGGYADINVLDLSTRCANDVIASCAFGTTVDSHNDVDNYFYTIGKNSANLGYKEMMTMFGYGSFPKIMKALNISILSEKAKTFFRSLVLSSIKEREENNIIRNDIIHVLMQARKELSDEDVVAQAVSFFFAGFDTIATGLVWIFHELAVNSDIQERLLQEINDNDAKTDGILDYKSIQEMKYLDMVLSETLRLRSPFPWLDRVCTKDYNFGKPNDKAEKDFILRKGQGVFIPIWGIQHDPQYFPDPNKFDPERFSDENKHKINPFAYMPFGMGPRICIGSRFALLEIKVMVYMMLRQFEVYPCEKTCLPERFDPSNLNLRLMGGHWLRFRLRN